MSTWLENNAVAIIGWIGTMIVLAFAFGRRFTTLEAADKALTKEVGDLAKSVTELTNHVNGHNGNAALSRAIDGLTAGLTSTGSRITTNERELALHEIRLARVDAMRESLEASRQDFYQRKWDPLIVQVNYLTEQMNNISTTLTRISTTMTEQEKRHG